MKFPIIQEKCQKLLFKGSLGYGLALASCLLLPLKLSICLVTLIPLVSMWLIANFGSLSSRFGKYENSHLVPYLLFIGLMLYNSFFGLDTLRSLPSILSLAFFSCSALVYADFISKRGIIPFIFALSLGQSTAAFHSILEEAFPAIVPELFLGKVTESGQLALTFVFALGTLFYLSARDAGLTYKTPPLVKLTSARLIALTSFLTLCALAFSQLLGFANWEKFAILLVVTAMFASFVWYALRLINNKEYKIGLAFIFISVFLPLMASALLINLKRGPWAGVIIATSIIFAMFSKRMLAPALVMAVAVICFISPVRSRIQQSYEHFSISGGRQAIWDIGAELALHYPLGIGYENSPVLRKFSTEIPPELRHFHSNLLNIIVETGWFGLCIFIWWVIALIKSAWSLSTKDQRSILSRSIGCAIISWQVAGLVEYNFGDSEILLVAMICLGALSALKKEALQNPLKEKESSNLYSSNGHNSDQFNHEALSSSTHA